MDPLRLYGVQPRALLGQKAAYDPHSFSPLLLTSRLCLPSQRLSSLEVCASFLRCVPDEHQRLLANDFELLATPREELSRYRAHGPAIDEPQPPLIELR